MVEPMKLSGEPDASLEETEDGEATAPIERSDDPQRIITGVRMLIVPGIGNSGPRHWQSLWEEKFQGAVRVVQRDWGNPEKDEWVKGLDEHIERFPEEEIALVGHSLACLTIAHWVRDRLRRAIPMPKIKGALLVAPTDPERYPPNIVGFSPTPLDPLPFPATVVASTNDPWIHIERSEAFARTWNARFVNLGERGHINADSNLGEWEEGQNLLRELMAAA